MKRSPVFKYVEDVPMRIHTQQEPDGTWVAVMPGWRLNEIMTTGETEDGAILCLKEQVLKIWEMKPGEG